MQLLLLNLVLIAKAKHEDAVMVVVSDVIMIGAGLIGALVTAPYKFVWWSVGTVFFIIIVNKLFKLMDSASRCLSPAACDVFKALSWLTIILWCGYPLLWLLGAEGTRSMPQNAEVGTITLLDLASKVGFGMYLLFNLDAIDTDAGYSETVHLRADE